MRPIKAKIPRSVVIDGGPHCTVYEELDLEKIWPGDKEAHVTNLHTMKIEYRWDVMLHSWIPRPEYRDPALKW